MTHAELATPSSAPRPQGTQGPGEQDTEQETLPNPTVPGTVFLRGAGASRDTWRALEQSLRGRGYMTVSDRTQAWHLARAGVTVVMVDFSHGPADRPSVTVARVRARWRISHPQKTIGDLLSRTERERLTATGATWMSTRVTAEVRDMELPIHQDTITLDTTTPDTIADAVTEQLQTGSR